MCKIARGVTLCLLLVLCLPCTVKAYTAEELYSDLGIEYTDPHSESDMNTITEYRVARRYVRIFNNLSNMEFDEVDLSNIICSLEAQLANTEAALNNGYSLTLDEIYELEMAYIDITEELKSVQEIQDEKEIPLKSLDLSKVPTYADYARANARNTLVDTRLELGSSVPKITANAYVVSDYTETTMTVGTTDLAVIEALFNGEVIDVNDDVVTLYHYNDIYTSYKGLVPDVAVGDTVYQGKCVGYSIGSVSVKMRVGGNFINIYEYLKGVE